MVPASSLVSSPLLLHLLLLRFIIRFRRVFVPVPFFPGKELTFLSQHRSNFYGIGTILWDSIQFRSSFIISMEFLSREEDCDTIRIEFLQLSFRKEILELEFVLFEDREKRSFNVNGGFFFLLDYGGG